MTAMPVTVGFPQIRKLMSGEMTWLIRPRAQRISTLKVADRLWVREPYCFAWRFDGHTPLAAVSLGAKPIFLADFADQPWNKDSGAGKARVAYTLPRACHRQHLKITEIKTIRLHDLGPDDLVAQGFQGPRQWGLAWDRALAVCGPGRDRWENNPQVLALKFERVDRPLPVPVKGARS
jgi:hypothetical protein